MRKIQLCVAVAFTCVSYLDAYAIPFTQELLFKAEEQSLWGSGSTADFGTSGTVDMGLFDFKYDFAVNSGTVFSTISGALSADYDDYLVNTGSTTINIGFIGDSSGGLLETDLLARAKAWVPTGLGDIDILTLDYGLNINKTFTPELGATVSASDSFTYGTTGVDVLFAEAGMDLDIEQTASLSMQALGGKLAYQHRDGGTMYTSDFLLDSGGSIALDVDLGLEGVWDFWFIDEMLDNLFETSFDLEMVLFEEHWGRTGCSFEVLGECIIPSYGTIRNETLLADIDVYNGSPFDLAFEQLSDTASFYIQVGGGTSVPEPTVLVLMALGLGGIGFRRIMYYDLAKTNH